MMRVLVVDDEPQLMRALRINLTARRYDVVVAADGATALEAAARHIPDLVILDLGLPDMDGTEVIAGLRGWTKVPILVLSGRADASDKVDALDAGADDYVTKPFSMDELMARLRALQRRAEADAAAAEPVVLIGHFSIDLAAKTVIKRPDAPAEAPEKVHLTKTEWAVLEVLVRNPGRLVSGKQLLQQVWGPGYESETNYLRFYLARLRQKLETEPSHPRQLLTEPGMGYRFQP
ncbi:response regulator transcription factor [Actinospica sp. MGRD01-02]|uniref:Response regulator transcription factor n=1 Tax=Actinospica acidithermotolerans TaxID=2828514 RepID=A0A941E7Q1_9ACTN|nr:response regulator transcription factor [Actinospica acidithermotolerans]MBR7826022.1 response regulator transcription factor [Actinospica acidithermotolerans]